MDNVTVKFKLLHKDAKVPHFAKPGDAGMDITSVESTSLWPGDIKLVKTGLAMEIPVGWEAQIVPRSGLALKDGVTVLNSPGTIDSGYRNEIGIILVNHHQTKKHVVKKGDRIAQMKIKPVATSDNLEIVLVEELSDSERGQGGFGHTGS